MPMDPTSKQNFEIIQNKLNEFDHTIAIMKAEKVEQDKEIALLKRENAQLKQRFQVLSVMNVGSGATT